MKLKEAMKKEIDEMIEREISLRYLQKIPSIAFDILTDWHCN